MASIDLQTQYKKTLNTYQTIPTRFCLCYTSTQHNSVHQDDPTKATFLNEQFQSVFSRKSPNRLSSLCHMKLQESTDADRSMLDITVTSTGIEKLLSNLKPHKVAGLNQIKPIILKKTFDSTIINPKTSLPKVARHGNLTTNLEGC